MNNGTFPVIYSTLDSTALTACVLSRYDIDPIARCQFWLRGLSDVYLVETRTRRYILKVSHHHWRSKADIDFELEWLDFLRQHQLPVAYPLKTAEGQFSIEIKAPEGDRYAALFVYAPGTVAVGDLSAAQGRTLGETVAKLHQVGDHFRSTTSRQPLTPEYLLDDSLQEILPFLLHRPADLEYLRSAIAHLKAKLQNFPVEPPFWSVCWGDPHSGNAHFTPQGEISVFDFDQCGYGWRAFDVAKFLQVSLRAGLGKVVRDAFLSGYQDVEVLTEWELAALPLLTQTAHIWVWAISLQASKIRDRGRLDDSYFIRRLEQLKRLRSPEWALF